MRYLISLLAPILLLTACAGNPINAVPVTITVLNQGYKASSQKTKAATGKAKFAADNTTGHLKVSFFGPFYGDYIIFDLDKTNYSRAYVSGGKDNYLWLLSRTPTITQSVRNDFLEKSKALGYDTESLIWVDHSDKP